MKATMRRARRTAGAIRRRLFETAESTAWRRAVRQAESTPRLVPGRIGMMEYDIHYADLLSFCPQWHSIFVKGSLAFRTVSSSPRILDCGGNIGLASLYFKRAHPTARITSYEADPSLFALLTENLARNGAGAVETVHAALWTSTGTLSFNCEGADSGMIGTLPGAVDGRATVVPSLRLRDILEREPIDLLKLDVEGAERLVLDDCESALGNVRAIVMDLHEFDAASRSAPHVLDLLTRAGYEYVVDELTPLPWRDPVATDATPFPGAAMTWAMTVRAWRVAA